MRTILTGLFLAIVFLLQAEPTTISEYIRIDQFGYRLNAQKIAVLTNPQTGYNAADSYTPGSTFEVRQWSDDTPVYFGAITIWNGGAIHAQSGDKAWWFDFSNVTTAGDYYLYDATNDVGSYRFTIGDDVYINVLKAALHTFYLQRCGTTKITAHAGDWADNATCHLGTNQDLTCRLVTDQTNAALEKDLSGGWHDAGDYNKYTNFTYTPLHSLLFAFQHNSDAFDDANNIPESGNGLPDILDEIKFELDWLLKMQNADGSVLSKVSVDAFQGVSPPSADAAARYYGEASASSTRTFASVMAHAYAVLKDYPSQVAYANNLLAKAELAWDWLVANPGISNYGNTGFSSANPEIDAATQNERQTGAAVFLFDATGDTSYRTYFDANYTTIRSYSWGYWYPFQPTIQDIMLYYTSLASATTGVKNNIISNSVNSITSGNSDLLPAWQSNADPYRANLGDSDWVWGSNQVKARMGLLFQNLNNFNLDASNSTTYTQAAESYLHYLHGQNANGRAMLTNAESLGADHDCDEMYHGWFGNGTDYDNAETSLYGPPPAYITGGVNKNFSPDGAFGGTISPPEGQPIQKAYKDWNTSWPENSWELTEPAIYYQAAYIQLLANFVAESVVLPVELTEFTGKLLSNGEVELNWWTASREDVDILEIERSRDNQNFEKIGQTREFVQGKNTFIDTNPHIGSNYYRLKIKDLDGDMEYSQTLNLQVARDLDIKVFPNPATQSVNVHLHSKNTLQAIKISIVHPTGIVSILQEYSTFTSDFTETIRLDGLKAGIYWLKIEANGRESVERLVVRN